ncbi:MAG TPA: hypothetical protein VMW16_09370 [Sedimentisphaerales bacterium]|nr:hypothetical protein [Sedimentisphaerales bacterium]
MCRKSMSLICFVLVLGLVGSASAQYLWTNADPANALWTTPGNWNPPGPPGAAELALITSPPAQGPVINTDVSVGEIGGLRMGSDVDQVMEISSGNVNIGWWWGLAEGGNGTATLNMVGNADIKVGGIEGAYSGTTIINIGGTTKISESYEWRLSNEPGATLELNIGDDADIHMGPEKNAWRFADRGTAVTNISGNANVYIDGKWRNGDEDEGHSEINMSGGTLYVAQYLSCYDNGSAKITFSGGTANVGGLSYAGRAGKAYELNISGTADVTASEMVRLGYSMNESNPGGSAALNVSGGALTSGLLQTYGDYGSISINLSGGVVSVGGLDLIGPYSMDVCGGTLIVNGDVTDVIQAGIDAGYIVACGGDGKIAYDYDVRNAEKTTVTAVLVGNIDIKPGSCPNPLNLESKGVLCVAVLGSEALDVTMIDPASVRLQGVVAPVRSSLQDVSGPPADGGACDCGEGPDGYTDLVLKFKTQDVVAELIPDSGELNKGDVLVLTLTAGLTNGKEIMGEDCVVLVGNVLKATAARQGDVNKNGFVDLADFASMAQYWLEAAEY